MKQHHSLEKFTNHVLAAYAQIEDDRTRELMLALIQHLHLYIKTVKLTEGEWEKTWSMLAEMAHFTGEERNEFLLLADVLGTSQLIEMMNHQRPSNTVGFALVGPFYRANAPLRTRGESIASQNTEGDRVAITGKVIDITTGNPIPQAQLDVWQAATNGLYETQDPNQPSMNLRGKFLTDHKGTFELQALMPTPYPVPMDGPVGKLMSLAKRHPNRPAHIHFIVSAPNYETLITQVFVSGDEIIETDAVFTASDNMTGHFVKENNHYTLHYDFQLSPGESTYPKAPIK